jgi:ribose transport system permease protein
VPEIPAGLAAEAAGPSAGRANWAFLFLLLETGPVRPAGHELFSPENLQNILIACLPVLLLAVGETFVIITGGIDLSVGFVMGFATVVCAKFMLLLQAAGLPPGASIPLAALICLAIGLIPGLINGTLVARLKVPPFLATFGCAELPTASRDRLGEYSDLGASAEAADRQRAHLLHHSAQFFLSCHGNPAPRTCGSCCRSPMIVVIFSVCPRLCLHPARTRFDSIPMPSAGAGRGIRRINRPALTWDITPRFSPRCPASCTR